MRLLIVEDEPSAREGLFKLLRNSLPTWEILEPCKNGASGLQSIRSNGPDIIITDIRMPSGDGLEMIKQMRAESHGAAVIILSGYPDFETARQCLALGVQDYLVKPVSVDEILAAVLRSEATLFSSSELLRQLEGSQVKQEPSAGMLYCFRTREPLNLTDKKILRQEVRRICGNQVRVQAAEFQPDNYYFFFSHGPSVPSRHDQRGFLETLSKRFRQPVSGCAMLSSGGDLTAVAARLKESLRRFLLLPPSPFFLLDPLAVPRFRPFRYHHRFEKEFSVAFQSSNKSGIPDLFERVCREFASADYDPNDVMEALKRFQFFVQNLVKDLDLPRFAALLELDLVTKLNRAVVFDDLLALFRSLADLVASQPARTGPATEDLHVQKALVLIEENLLTPLSLEQVSEKLGISTQYLSRRFKEQLGVGFAQFLIQKRIELSKGLLASPEESIREVAEKSGFMSQKYFCACFKKATGFTPSEYRQRFL